MKISQVVELAEKYFEQSSPKSIMKESAEEYLKTAKKWQEIGNVGQCVSACLNSLYYTIGFLHPDYAKVRRILTESTTETKSSVFSSNVLKK